MQHTAYTLKIDPEFRRLVPPPTLEERKALEEEILNPDRSRVIRVWYNTILVDYTYYEYCQLLQLPYETAGIPYVSREEVLAWICENQLQRPELTVAMWRYLIGKRSATEITLGAHQHSTQRQRTTRRAGAVLSRSKFDSSQTGTRERIGKQYGLANATVWKYERYAEALDRIRETVPDLIDDHLAGRVRISLDRAEAIAALTPKEIQEECRLILSERQLDTPTTWRKRLLQEPVSAPPESGKTASIKDMPEYDPDAEISSLALTVPSWVSSIVRVCNAADIRATTRVAREQLAEALIRLTAAADVMLLRLKEGEQSGLQ